MNVNEKKDVEKLFIDKIYICAETAFSHEGDINYLYQLVDQAAMANSDAVKFQVMFEPTESYGPEITNQSNCFVEWHFEEKEWIELLRYAKDEKKLDVVLLPVDMKAVEFCLENQELFDMIEIHSINFNHSMMLKQIKELNKIIILGIGGRTLADIEYTLKKLHKAYKEHRLLLMHGFQSFPTQRENVKLSRIAKYREFWGTEVGYADHTSFNENDIPMFQFAYLNGCRFFEKHIVLEEGKKRTDYQAAREASHLLEIRNALKELIEIQGNDSVWDLSEAETIYRKREKKIVATNDINENEILTEDNLGYKVTNQQSAYEQKDFECLLGKRCICDVKKNSTAIIVK